MGLVRHALAMVAVFAGCSAPVYAVPWFSYGPAGGDARSFAADPKDPAHLYMGAANGWLFQSRDAGRSWTRLAQLGERDDLVIDNIVVDPTNPQRLVVGAWVVGDLGHPDGGVYLSEDGGAKWTTVPDMKGQSVLSLVVAPSDPKLFVAGTLEGVFRSTDGGALWQRISPKENREIHEVESLAIDPADPNKIFAGTWHLPWKTTDGGATWSSMKDGLIEDSDIFSIIIDPKQPSVVYLSACSGIYKSEDGGGKFTGGVGQNKRQGIPADARRTRVLMQDPSHPDTVFAGTTEGLYRTMDAGKTWVLKTTPNVIVNDVYVDPSDSQHVLLATDRGGVLMSNDGGASFAPSNDGFSARQITAFAQDMRNPAVVYVGVVNDKELGGVFVSRAGGMSWSHLAEGLAGNDVTSLVQAPDGEILAGTGHGIYRLQNELWRQVGADARVRPGAVSHTASALRSPASPKQKQAVKPVQSFVDEDVYGFTSTRRAMYAATSAGLLMSVDSGMTWSAVDSIPAQDWRHVASTKDVVVAASLNADDTSTMAVSLDGGNTWKSTTPPAKSTPILALAVDGDGGIWIGDRDCIYYSTDKGANWEAVPDPVVRNVTSLYYDQHSNRILVVARIPEKKAFALDPGTLRVTTWETGWNMRFLRPVGNYLVGATWFDGIVVQPRMVDSAEIAKP